MFADSANVKQNNANLLRGGKFICAVCARCARLAQTAMRHHDELEGDRHDKEL